MPYLRIQTNHEVAPEQQKAVIKAASSAVAKGLGKPEQYVMVSFAPSRPMVFAGNDEPCAYLELKSIGLPTSKTKDLSALLCGIVTDRLDVPGDRIYIEFADAPRAMWGWNGSTF